jgi:hypothetical protein
MAHWQVGWTGTEVSGEDEINGRDKKQTQDAPDRRSGVSANSGSRSDSVPFRPKIDRLGGSDDADTALTSKFVQIHRSLRR